MVARTLTRALVASLLIAGVAHAQTRAPASYRSRLLGVFNSQSGEPVEGAEVVDMLGKISARTTATGTITLSYLPEGETLLRIRKVGFDVATMLVAISPVDTVPLTVLLKPTAQVLPTTYTTDSLTARRIAPGLRDFELRRARGIGVYVTEAELRKNDAKKMTTIARSISGLKVGCNHNGSVCVAMTTRQNSRYALLGGACTSDVYVDGILSSDNNLEQMRVDQFAAVEYYAGAARTPVEYNKTGSSCGVLLLWTRER